MHLTMVQNCKILFSEHFVSLKQIRQNFFKKIYFKIKKYHLKYNICLQTTFFLEIQSTNSCFGSQFSLFLKKNTFNLIFLRTKAIFSLQDKDMCNTRQQPQPFFGGGCDFACLVSFGLFFASTEVSDTAT